MTVQYVHHAANSSNGELLEGKLMTARNAFDTKSVDKRAS